MCSKVADLERLAALGRGAVRLYMVRHGETAANAAHLVQGAQLDSALTERGLRQAAALADAFAEHVPQLERVFSSPLLRARQTAEAVCAALSLEQRPSWLLPDLREMEYGALDGRSLRDGETIRELRALWQRWRADPAAARCPGPGGESMAALVERGAGALRAIVAQTQKAPEQPRHVAVVAHGMLLRAVLADLGAAGDTGKPIVSRMDSVQLANASLTVLDFAADGELAGVWLVNSTDHLAAEDQPKSAL